MTNEPLRDRLVLVTHDRDAQRLVQAALEPRQARVVTAAGDDETVAAARGERPDLIVAGVDGTHAGAFAVARQLKDDSTTATIPVLALTRQPGPDLQQRAQSAGFDALLIEPITLTTFAQVAGLLIERADLLRERSLKTRQSAPDFAPRRVEPRPTVADARQADAVGPSPPATAAAPRCRSCGSDADSQLVRRSPSSLTYRCGVCHNQWRLTFKRRQSG